MPTINGQFIPRNQLGGTAPAPTGGASTSGGGTNDLPALLKQALAQKYLQSGKLSDQAKGVNLLQPSSQELDTRKKAGEEATAKGKQEKQFRALEDLYFKNNIAQGNLGGIDDAIKAANLFGLQIDPNNPYSIYKGQLGSLLAGFAKGGSAFGNDTGNIGYVEQLLQRAAFPGARSTPKTAKTKFAEQRGKFGLEPRTDYSVSGLPGTKNAGANIYGSSLELD